MKATWSKIALTLGFVTSSSAFSIAHAESLVAIDSANRIGVFQSTSALIDTNSFVEIIGLDKSINESFIGIDLRPSNNTLYGITTANKLYTLDAYTGVASFVAALTTVTADGTVSYALKAGEGYGVDFNPVADRNPAAASLRVVNSDGANLAVNVNASAAGVVGNTGSDIGPNPASTELAPLPDRQFTAVAYANSDPNLVATATQLYYLDSAADTLSRADGAFNAPTISLIGAIGIDILRANGFELFSNGNAFAAVNLDNGTDDSLLLGINLTTGKGTLLGAFNGTINSLAAAPSAVPVPAAAWLFGSALLGLAGLRRKSV